jgi:hypothetical protein
MALQYQGGVLISFFLFLQVVSVSSKDEVKQRPSGLNTVELLKVASSSLNIGPAHAMQVRCSISVISVDGWHELFEPHRDRCNMSVHM